MPTRAIGLLMVIGFVDLLMTAVLHRHGLIIELNPLMRPLIERSEWLFAIVKGATLILAWWAMIRYAKTNLLFVRQAALVGSCAYLAIWNVWFWAGQA